MSKPRLDVDLLRATLARSFFDHLRIEEDFDDDLVLSTDRLARYFVHLSQRNDEEAVRKLDDFVALGDLWLYTDKADPVTKTERQKHSYVLDFLCDFITTQYWLLRLDRLPDEIERRSGTFVDGLKAILERESVFGNR